MDAAYKEPTSATKAEIYETLAVINRSLEQFISAIYKLGESIDLGEDYAFSQEIIASDLWARTNSHILARIAERELDDKNHFSRMRVSLEKRRKTS
jgi:hypothetical protein